MKHRVVNPSQRSGRSGSRCSLFRTSQFQFSPGIAKHLRLRVIKIYKVSNRNLWPDLSDLQQGTPHPMPPDFGCLAISSHRGVNATPLDKPHQRPHSLFCMQGIFPAPKSSYLLCELIFQNNKCVCILFVVYTWDTRLSSPNQQSPCHIQQNIKHREICLAVHTHCTSNKTHLFCLILLSFVNNSPPKKSVQPPRRNSLMCGAVLLHTLIFY